MGKVWSTYCGVGCPDLETNVGEGLAGRGVDDLDVEDQLDTILTLGNVRADILARDVYIIGISISQHKSYTPPPPRPPTNDTNEQKHPQYGPSVTSSCRMQVAVDPKISS